MLLTLLFHRVGKGKYCNSLTLFEELFEWLSKKTTTVVPGDPLSLKGEVCLTFDDATFDFYHFIFPLLQKWKLKAILAVPVSFILDTTSLGYEERLKAIQDLPKNIPLSPSPAFCTFDELREMHDSKLVHIASHSMSHIPLTSSTIDPLWELKESKKILENKLNCKISTFVYPYGIFTNKIHDLARKSYTYLMRIGNASNFSWQNTNYLHYRINADALSNCKSPFCFQKRIYYFCCFILNSIRKK